MNPQDRGHEHKTMRVIIFTYPCWPLVIIHMPTRNAVFLKSANYQKITFYMFLLPILVSLPVKSRPIFAW